MYMSIADLLARKMARTSSLSRDSIVHALTQALEPLPFVHAFYEGGAAAFDRIDQWSDLDFYVVADDTSIADTFRVIEETLEALSPLRLKHEVTWPPASGIHQKFYRLADTDEFLLVDLAVLTRSAPDKFLVREIHGDVVFLFNKEGVVTIPPLDQEALVRAIVDRRRRLRERIELFGPFVRKELYRGNGLEALEFYRALVLPSLVEALRMRHGPRHYDFRMRYVYRELPRDVLERLEALAFVKDRDDLAAKALQALAWFHEAIEAVNEDESRKRIAGA
jgi:hypothetical protein